MKKNLVRVGILAAIIFSTHIGFSKETSSFQPTGSRGFYISWSPVDPMSIERNTYTPMLGLNTEENLKAYHIGLKLLRPNHVMPTTMDMRASIESHPTYRGLLTQNQGVELFAKEDLSFLLFEEINKEKGHFYIAHSKGLRHFTIGALMVGKSTIAQIDNHSPRSYPDLPYFIKSTLLSI